MEMRRRWGKQKCQSQRSAYFLYSRVSAVVLGFPGELMITIKQNLFIPSEGHWRHNNYPLGELWDIYKLLLLYLERIYPFHHNLRFFWYLGVRYACSFSWKKQNNTGTNRKPKNLVQARQRHAPGPYPDAQVSPTKIAGMFSFACWVRKSKKLQDT